MNINRADRSETYKEDITNLFSESKLERLRELGHDFLEEGREGNKVIDHNGKEYLDCISGSGIFNLGRKNEILARALIDAVHETDQGNFPMISIEKAALAEKLAKFVGGNLECSVFSVIRGESIDFACKLARGYTGRKKFVTLKGSWFGQTGFALSLSDREERSLYGPLIPEIETIAPGDMKEAEKAINRETAGVFIEPVQGENDCTAADPEYLKHLRALCNKTGALLIFDETQTGLGRCGRPFAYQHSGISPDVLVIGEALGGGIFPIAATIFTQKINKFMNAHPMIHLSTFGGADQGCRTASAALDEYEKQKPWENAEKQGKIIMAGLQSIQKEYPALISSVTGTGLLISLELENQEKAVNFCRSLAGAGLLALPGEVADNTVVLRPGLLLSDAESAELINAVEQACREMDRG